MKRSALISDVIFTFFASFLCALILFRLLSLSIFWANALAILCGILIAAAFATAKRKKLYRFLLKKSDETLKEKLLFHLALLDEEEVTNFFLERLSVENNQATRAGKLRIATQSELYLLRFQLAPVSKDEIIHFFQLKTSKRKLLLCNHLEEGCAELCKKLQILPLEGEQIFLLLKEKDCLPQTFLGDDLSYPTKRRFQLWFSKANSKRFLVSGALILLTAFITPFPLYYLLVGGVLTVTAILVKIFGTE